MRHFHRTSSAYEAHEVSQCAVTISCAPCKMSVPIDSSCKGSIQQYCYHQTARPLSLQFPLKRQTYHLPLSSVVAWYYANRRQLRALLTIVRSVSTWKSLREHHLYQYTLLHDRRLHQPRTKTYRHATYSEILRSRIHVRRPGLHNHREDIHSRFRRTIYPSLLYSHLERFLITREMEYRDLLLTRPPSEIYRQT